MITSPRRQCKFLPNPRKAKAPRRDAPRRRPSDQTSGELVQLARQFGRQPISELGEIPPRILDIGSPFLRVDAKQFAQRVFVQVEARQVEGPGSGNGAYRVVRRLPPRFPPDSAASQRSNIHLSTRAFSP